MGGKRKEIKLKKEIDLRSTYDATIGLGALLSRMKISLPHFIIIFSSEMIKEQKGREIK